MVLRDDSVIISLIATILSTWFYPRFCDFCHNDTDFKGKKSKYSAIMSSSILCTILKWIILIK